MSRRREIHLTHDGWERSRCSICRLGREGKLDLLRIEKLLADGGRLKPIAEKFGLNWCALRRHWIEVSAGALRQVGAAFRGSPTS